MQFCPGGSFHSVFTENSFSGSSNSYRILLFILSTKNNHPSTFPQDIQHTSFFQCAHNTVPWAIFHIVYCYSINEKVLPGSIQHDGMSLDFLRECWIFYQCHKNKKPSTKFSVQKQPLQRRCEAGNLGICCISREMEINSTHTHTHSVFFSAKVPLSTILGIETFSIWACLLEFTLKLLQS